MPIRKRGRKPLPNGYMTLPMLYALAKQRNIPITRAHIENMINRNEIKGLKRDLLHKKQRRIFPIAEGKKILQEFALRQPPAGFVTVPQALKMIRDRGVKSSRSGLEKTIDKGLLSGAKLVFAPKHGRIISKEIVEQIILNLQEGRPATFGLGTTKKPWKKAPKKTSEKKRIPKKVLEEKRAKAKAPAKKTKSWRRENRDMIKKWIAFNAPRTLSAGQEAFINRIVNQNADLPPAEFHEKIIPIIRRILGI